MGFLFLDCSAFGGDHCGDLFYFEAVVSEMDLASQ
jgi:hypothetical protein